MNPTSTTSARGNFEEVALTHVDGMYNLALHLTRNPADAEDLVQDTFLRAYRHFDRFRSGTNFKAWIFTILKRLAINRYKKVKRGGIRVTLDTVENTLEGFVPVETHQFEDSDIRAAVDRLPEDYRVTFLLYAVEGFTYEEISGIMRCPIGTVMSRLFRARRRLQDDLSRQDRLPVAPAATPHRLKYA